jgi:flagellar biogenesis protein FliO
MQVLTNDAQGAEGLTGWLLSVLRRWRNSTAAAPRQMKVVESLALGGRRQLTLVVCGTERFLVGGGVESVNVILRVSPDNQADVALDGCV